MSDNEEGEGSDFDTGFYEDNFKRFEEYGPDRVLSMLSGRELTHAQREPALVWLSRKARDQAREDRAIAIAAKATVERAAEAAERQANSAERANVTAKRALAIAVISMFVAAFSIWITHRDAFQSTSASIPSKGPR